LEILLIHLFSHFVALPTDGRPNPYHKLFGLGGEPFLQQAHAFSCHLDQSPLPAGVHQAHNVFIGVIKYQWDTIRKTHDERDFGVIRKDAIRWLVFLIWRAGMSGVKHGFAVHLPDVEAALIRPAKILKEQMMVGKHVFGLIANCAANIEGSIRPLAAASQPGIDRMVKASDGKLSKL